MKQFIKQAFQFIVIVLLIGISLNLLLPENKYWGNREYAWKLKQYKKDKYNTVLFGTSRIYRGINPLLLDSLINQNSAKPMKSFNMATHASWFNETLYLYDLFIKDSSLSNGVETVIMEYQNIMSINPKKLTDEKIIYYQNLDHYRFILRYSFYEVLREPKKIITSLYSVSVFSLVSFINLTNLKRVSTKLYTKDPSEHESINERGYLGFNKMVDGQGISNEGIKKFTDNINLFLHQKESKFNPVYYAKMMELVEKSKKRGIKLIFVLPPVRLTNGMMAVFNVLPAENKIEICDPIKYPELYELKNWIDPVHLNKIGSGFLTKHLFEELGNNNMNINTLTSVNAIQ